MQTPHFNIEGNNIPTLDLESLLQKAIDVTGLFLTEIMVNVKIYQTVDEVTTALTALDSAYQPVCTQVGAAFDANTMTIHIALQNYTAGIMGHEITHALIAKYFVVPMPVNAQEILCGYVNFEVNKES